MNSKSILVGIVGGLIGGLVFGGMLAVLGMLPLIAKLIGSTSSAVGLIVHLVNSAIIGGIFGAIVGSKASKLDIGAISGLVYGIVWWFLGPLIIMPSVLGKGVQLSLSGMQAAFPSLMGHIVYGLILGITFSLIYQKATDKTAKEKPAAEEA